MNTLCIKENKSCIDIVFHDALLVIAWHCSVLCFHLFLQLRTRDFVAFSIRCIGL